MHVGAKKEPRRAADSNTVDQFAGKRVRAQMLEYEFRFRECPARGLGQFRLGLGRLLR